ncbi:MAG TPA: VOC family protein [Acetobacteraceae bacterium]|nr:VOC family protein [Acetobacteraceae bacterium]
MQAKQFVWYELVTSDVDAALAFYKAVLGWESRDFDGQGPRYAIVSAGGKGVGGVMALCEGMSHPFWLGYIGTRDMDGTLARFTGAGGKVMREPWTIPSVGRLAIVADPQGAGLALIEPVLQQPSEAFDQHSPGHGHWHELHTPDPAAAFVFYAAQFGWTKGEAMELGPMGTYQLFKVGEAAIGGMFKACENVMPGWLYYFGTDSVRRAVARVESAGGSVLKGPSEVPGGAHVIQARDPQGAMFALVGPA